LPETRLNQYWVIVIVFLIAVIVVTGFIAWSRYRPSRPSRLFYPRKRPSAAISTSAARVANPGIYPFSGDDTIGTLIQSAGGVNTGAQSDSLQLNIPAAAGGAAASQKININSAGSWLLEALPGIGPTKAKAIIDYRQKNGFFRSVDELTKVDGISPALLAQIKSLVTVAD